MNNALDINAEKLAHTICLAKMIMLDSNKDVDVSIYNQIDQNILSEALERIALSRLNEIVTGRQS